MQMIGDWWSGLARRYQLIVGGVLVVVVGIGLGGWLITSRAAPAPLPAAVPPAQAQTSHPASHSVVGVSAASQVSSHDTRVFVDVQGAVAHPGLYEFSAGMRVADAVKSAGGLTAKADRQQVNLASRLTDQQQLAIPMKGEKPVDVGGKESAATKTSQSGGGASAKSGGPAAVINLNTATVTDLQQLTGIGEKKAQKIVDYRTAHGSFQTVKDLTQVPGFGEKTVANLQDQLTT
ncbi:helix-hairpin-helix domain-containing protein [Levilactobacillus parabrevis]|uniref:DNA uptake protein related DNA-binding protein n=1 Tax=Levilactobacillus parabrevis ATCC 53295 TaxID=1267003 RepID=A0A0R1GUC3_9LACO|nr:helix-hairpin-helix domain-containing protein [Levilactobacillus parabrevis]KRK37830.1 DNA uptake protein related DNA-binding protein [Levilactobacillus parabrevis ATCC 53295]KRO06389.1 DNA uptake protein related DNA-binding protein [Levilactobacillus parabrevis]